MNSEQLGMFFAIVAIGLFIAIIEPIVDAIIKYFIDK